MSFMDILLAVLVVAVIVLVVFLIRTIHKITAILGTVNETVAEVKRTVNVVTTDVDHLSLEVQGLLQKSNTLLNDVNGKLGKTDPLFQAIGDLGTSVSKVNHSAQQVAKRFVIKRGAKQSSATRTVTALKRIIKQLKK